MSKGQPQPETPTPPKASPGVTGAAKRKAKPMMDATAVQQQQQQQQPILMLAAQQGISPQQMQQLLQQQVLTPQQLQQVIQQQTLLLQQQQQQQKLQEQLLHQLNEQLQLNILQQSQLLQQQQTEKSKNNKQIQQRLQELGIQQQQLIQQIQLQQRQYLLSQGIGMMQPFAVPQAMTPAEIQQLWKEVASQSGVDGSSDLKNYPNGVALAAASAAATVPVTPVSSAYLTNGFPDGYLLAGGGLIGQPAVNLKQDDASSLSHPLYRHGLCKWPGCDTPSEDFPIFMKHLNSEHKLDDRSTAQARVQMQVVSQLEIQLTREKELLQAMMQHLHMKPQSESKPEVIPPVLPKQQQHSHHQQQQQANQQSHQQQKQISISPPTSTVTLVTSPITMTPTLTTTPTQIPAPHPGQASQQTPSSAGPIRRRVSDKCNLPISAGMQRDVALDNAFFSFVEIQRNREFYRTTDVRPPFTYASLIRQAIIESPHRQLTLNEIYQWFQNTFAYFRRNEATWKNAIRTNLSLHKCFVRYEDDFGSFWMVDDFEFIRRRHLTRGRPRKYHETETAQPNPIFTSLYRNSSRNIKKSRNLSLKTPTLSQDPSLFGENLNASLRAALGENSLSIITNGQLVSPGMDGAEDLSMKTQNSNNNNSLEAVVNSDHLSEDELMLSIKQEPPADPEDILKSSGIHPDVISARMENGDSGVTPDFNGIGPSPEGLEPLLHADQTPDLVSHSSEA